MQPDSYTDLIDLRHKDNRCVDYDEDCDDVPCKLTCWLHDPELGVCPYLVEPAP